jgi:hypothetical protein
MRARRITGVSKKSYDLRTIKFFLWTSQRLRV